MVLAVELLFFLSLIFFAFAGIAALVRLLRTGSARRRPWGKTIRTEDGYLVVEVSRPGEERVTVVQIPIGSDDFENRLLTAEVDADELVETLNRSRRRQK